ncbi:MAG: hypothetical protein O3C09_02830, partial [Proteobacteria bacterium]|nr:hypothetical protein [Pseudomonadota bacterium]
MAALLAPVLSGAAPALAQVDRADLSAISAQLLIDRLNREELAQVFPRAEELEVVEGVPPAVAVLIGGKLAGYVFSTRDTVRTTGYSGQSFDLVAGMKLDGTITGAVLLVHREAIVGRGVPQERLDGYVAGFAAATLDDFGAVEPDALISATVSARAMKNGVRNAARLVFAGHVAGDLDLPPPVTTPSLDRSGFGPISIADLLAWGSIVHDELTVADVTTAFTKAAGRGATPDRVAGAADDELFLETYAALVTPATVGVNMLGDSRHRAVAALEGGDGLTLWIGSKGRIPLVPEGFFLRGADFVIERIKIVQDG